MSEEELLKLLKEEAIPNQEKLIKLKEELLSLTQGEENDNADAYIKLRKRHIQLISNKIIEIESKMGI